MTKYTLVFAFVLVICTYKIATANENPAGQNPTAGANLGQDLTNKATTTTSGVNKAEEESEEESEESEEEPKTDGKPSTGIQNSLQTGATNSAAKPATTGSTQAVNKGKEESEEESEESDEEPKKDGKPSTGVQKPVQTSTYPAQGVTPKSARTQNAAASPTNINNVEAAKYSNSKTSADQNKLKRQDAEEEAENYSDDASDDTSYDDKNKNKYATPIVYYTHDSESHSGQKKGHGRSKSAANSIRRRYHSKPIIINIPINIY